MKITVWDVETLPLLGHFWSLRQDYIPHDWVVQESSIVCASWWTLDHHKGPQSISILDNQTRYKASVYDDRVCIKRLHQVIKESDILVGQNSDRFDLRVFNSRATLHGLSPLPPIETVDTLKEARKLYRLHSYKLDAMGRYFLDEKKMDTGGMKLWLDIVQRDYPPLGESPDPERAERAVRKMMRYNKKDVRLARDIYLHIRPWMKRHPNARIYYEKHEGCPRCSSNDTVRDGVRKRRNSIKQQWRCKNCGGYFSSTVSKQIDRVTI